MLCGAGTILQPGDLANIDMSVRLCAGGLRTVPEIWSMLTRHPLHYQFVGLSGRSRLFYQLNFFAQERRTVYICPAPHFIPILLVHAAVTSFPLPKSIGQLPQPGTGLLVCLAGHNDIDQKTGKIQSLPPYTPAPPVKDPYHPHAQTVKSQQPCSPALT